MADKPVSSRPSEDDFIEIGRLVALSFTSGALDCPNYRIVWNIVIEKFEH